MTAESWEAFRTGRDGFRELVQRLSDGAGWLAGIQDALRLDLGYDDYRIETPVVYNLDLDDVGPGDDPGFILVADNPGKNEQKASNRRYLVGQSGKLAAGWFRRELGMDFRRDVVIVNKTPVHTAKTAELRRLLALSGPHRTELAGMLESSQREMARLAFRLHSAMGNVLWISGYGELGSRGLFHPWADELRRLYSGCPAALREKVWVFRHFSMNQFSIEYTAARTAAAQWDATAPGAPAEPGATAAHGASSGLGATTAHGASGAQGAVAAAGAMELLERVGSANRRRILGF